MGEPARAPSPLAPSKRIVSIDALRGFAMLGILIMNIQSFSMIDAAYLNPTAYGDFTGINRWVWMLSHIFADKKFMTIFAMLFGAGIVLMAEKIEERGGSAAAIHYRRILWLIVIGLLHAYLLWHGDILVAYGLCGLIAYLFRKKRPGKLLAWGIAIFSVASLLYFFFGFSIPYWPEEALEGNMAFWSPAEDAVAKSLDMYRGSWLGQMPHRAAMSLSIQTFIFLVQTGWRALGLMLIGMALFKWGVLSGLRSRRFYTWMAVSGFAVGLTVIILGIDWNFSHNWSLKDSMFTGWQFNYWGSVFVSGGYIALMMLITSSARFRGLVDTLSAVGRMALTNYLAQTLICTTIFYGYGFGLFGKVDRAWHPLIVLAVWIPQLVWSPLWLNRFRFGPAEWLWRSLTYWRFQPMRKTN